MNKVQQSHPRLRKYVYLVAALALLAAGYAGIQLAAPSRATAGAATHGAFVIECPSNGTHC